MSATISPSSCSREAVVWPLGSGVEGFFFDVMGRVAVVDGRNDGFTSDVYFSILIRHIGLGCFFTRANTLSSQ